jgi:hypothetical protein
VWHKEEIELTIDDLRLLHKSVVHIGTLRWIENAGAMALGLFEESLSDTLVDDDKGNVGKDVSFTLRVILVCKDLF